MTLKLPKKKKGLVVYGPEVIVTAEGLVGDVNLGTEKTIQAGRRFKGAQGGEERIDRSLFVLY